MAYTNTILDPDTRIYLCPGEDEPSNEDTGVYVLPERSKGGENEGLVTAVQELLERTRLIDAKTDWIVRNMYAKKSRSRKKRYRRY